MENQRTKTRVSVAMAVCNGARYLRPQIDSILNQLTQDDELVIDIDPSHDASEKIVHEYAGKDKRVRVYGGPGKGVVCNFERALYHTTGAYIFLSDQDDVWAKEKVRVCLPVLQKQGVLAVVHNAIVTDAQLRETGGLFYKKDFSAGVCRNILKNGYMGCCMAFRRQLLRYALPFPGSVPMHDQWLGIVAAKRGKVEFIDAPLLYYRRHKNTMTGREKADIGRRIRWRMDVLRPYLTLRNKDI